MKGVRAADILTLLLWSTGIIVCEGPKVALLMALAVAVHELGHMLALTCMGESCRMRVGVFGFRMSVGELSYGREALVAAAGPAANLVCCGSMALYAPTSPGVTVNLLYAICNLLPIETLDGGRILSSLQAARGGTAEHERLCEVISVVSLSVLAIASLCAFWVSVSGGYLFIQAFSGIIMHLKKRQEPH